MGVIPVQEYLNYSHKFYDILDNAVAKKLHSNVRMGSHQSDWNSSGGGACTNSPDS